MWKPINFNGKIADDPRGEVAARARRAESQGDSMVAIPLSLAFALADLRECVASTMLDNDEDGPIPPMTIYCHKPEGHEHMHYNGYTHWSHDD